MDDGPVISVFGSGRAESGSGEYAQAEAVGRVLGERGYSVANGGYGGTMEAVSRGAKAAGAPAVIGVVCHLWSSRPNEFLDRAIDTDDIHHRVARLIELGSAGYVVLPGGTGTLMELASVWELAAKRHLPGRPVVCVGDYWRPLTELLGRSHPRAGERVSFVSAPGELAEHFPPARP